MDSQAANALVATRTALSQITALAVQYSFAILGAIILVCLGWFLARLISRWAFEGISKIHGIDITLAQFFSNVIRYALLMLVFVTVLGQFGVQTASIVAALGAAGLAIGLALQGTLQNIAAGIMLLVLRPLRVGEYIETSSVKGRVMDVGLFATELRTADGLYLMAPNSSLWNTPITNHSRMPDRRQALTIAVSNDADQAAVKAALLEIVKADARVQANPAPRAYTDEISADKVSFVVEYWARTSEWSNTRHDLTDAIRDRLQQMGIGLK